MKNIILIISISVCLALPAFADEAQNLTQQSMESIQQQTREMSELGIPEAQARKMLTQMVQNRFEKQNRVRAQQVVMDAAKAGLPTEPVMSKAMEGMAKQARQQQVIAAMETVHNRYAHASRSAKSLSENKKSIETLTTAMADSMAAGMTVQDMEAVMAQLQVQVQNRQQTRNKEEDDQLAIETMQTVRTMARLGVPSSDVSDTVCQALQNQYTHREMKQLRHQIAKNANQQTPQQIANKHAGSIGKGGNSGSADRAAGQADRATGPADRATVPADRAAGQADRAAGQADRVAGQAARVAGQAARVAGQAARVAGQAGHNRKTPVRMLFNPLSTVT